MITTTQNQLVDVLHGDCIDFVPALGMFDFIFADPPFNIGHGYNGYDDRRDDFVGLHSAVGRSLLVGV